MIYSLKILVSLGPITVAARSRAWTVFARSNTGIVGSNPTQGMDVCVRLFCLYAVLCAGRGPARGLSLVQAFLPTVLGLRNWSETKRFTDVLCSKWKQQEKRESSLGYWMVDLWFSTTSGSLWICLYIYHTNCVMHIHNPFHKDRTLFYSDMHIWFQTDWKE
jgi:hypothetical protein